MSTEEQPPRTHAIFEDVKPSPQLGRLPEPAPPATGPGDVASATDARDAEERPQIWHFLVLGMIAVLGLALRLREPLSSPIIGAEDPYLHMERTYNLISGQWVADYPIGFMILLAPFALLGSETFLQVARFLPAILGMGAVVTVFFLCRPYMHAAGGLTASLLIAVMPEHIVRTNALFPTALDLMLLPFVFLVVLRVAEGKRWAVPTLLGLALALLVIHPWVVALMVPPLLVFGLVALAMRREKKPIVASTGVAGALGIWGGASLFAGWSPWAALTDHAFPRLAVLFQQPTLLFTMPAYVDLDWQIGWPAIVLGGVGLVLAAVRHTRFSLLFLIWTVLLVPLTLVDWFDVWYLPHRTVVYLSIGVAILGGFTISEIVRALHGTSAKARGGILVGALGILLILTVPSSMAVQPWYRLYDEEDYRGYEELDARNAPFVMAGSWQGRAGYAALTGNDAVYHPGFFNDPNERAVELKKRPDMVVLVDQYTLELKNDVTFLEDGSQWRLIGQWGDTKAYERVAGS